MNSKNRNNNFKMSIFVWLIILTIMVFAIIIIGGLTRLTNSGLSMVNWRPILGTFPPLTTQEWSNVFDLYKQTPEYIYINKNITIEEFQYIFWWEWGHRFIARLVGVVFFFPFLYFIIKKKIKFFLIKRLIIVLLFGIFQAIVGWWMVKSGLTDNPYVSPYRLTFHLINALLIFSILLWTSMDYYYIDFNKVNDKITLYQVFLILSILLTFITIISGGFMAGTDSGQSFNTYPLMNGKFFPDDYFFEDLGILNIFENTVAINFNHRWLGTITFLFVFTICFYSILSNKIYVPKLFIYLILIILIIQFSLGVLTLLSNVDISYASLHQTNSVLLLSTLLITYHQFKFRKEIS